MMLQGSHTPSFVSRASRGSAYPVLLSVHPCQKLRAQVASFCNTNPITVRHVSRLCSTSTKHDSKTRSDEKISVSAGPDKEDNSSDDEDDVELSLSEQVLFGAAGTVFTGAILAWSSQGICSLLNAPDPQTHYILNWAHVQLALLTSIPALIFYLAVAAVPTHPKSTSTILEHMAETQITVEVPTGINIEVNLTPWLPDAASTLPPAPEDLAATDRPSLWGWRLTQLWNSQPWLRAIKPYEIGLLTFATAIETAGKEMLVRGTVVTVLAAAIGGQIAQADSNSLLFWFKVFKMTNEDTYRWIATSILGLGSLWAVTRQSKRVREWAGLVLTQYVYDHYVDTTTSATDSQQQAQGTKQGAASTKDEGSSSAINTAAIVSTNETSKDSSEANRPKVTSAADRQQFDFTPSPVYLQYLKDTNIISFADNIGKIQAVTPILYNALLGDVLGKEDGQAQATASSKPSDDSATENSAITSSVKPDVLALEGLTLPVPPVIDLTALAPVKEALLVERFELALGFYQTAQIVFLYGSTGNLLATLTAAVAMDIARAAVVQAYSGGADRAENAA